MKSTSSIIVSLLVMAIVASSLLAFTLKAARAEDERENDNEFEKETVHDNARETQNDGDWDLSKDFDREVKATPKSYNATRQDIENVSEDNEENNTETAEKEGITGLDQEGLDREEALHNFTAAYNITDGRRLNRTLQEFNEGNETPDVNGERNLSGRISERSAQNLENGSVESQANSDGDGANEVVNKYNNNGNNNSELGTNSAAELNSVIDKVAVDTNANSRKDERSFIVRLLSFLGLLR